MLAVAILEVMWADCGSYRALRYFEISPHNFTGGRLYSWLADSDELLVTNACPQLGEHASDKGTPDPEWLSANLELIQEERGLFDLLLVCGNVAQKTLDRCGYNEPFVRTVFCPHPAARTWTRGALDKMQRVIQEGVTSVHCRLRDGRLRVRRLPRRT